MNKDTLLKVGTQVAYIPPHVRREYKDYPTHLLTHPDTEFGFVSSWNEETVFVRFWSKYYPYDIRTLSTSEGCSWRDLELYDAHSDQEVQEVIERFRNDSYRYGWREQMSVEEARDE